jgi:hypothetical protein
MGTIRFTATRELQTKTAGGATAAQVLLDKVASRIGEAGVIVLPNGKRLTGTNLRQLGIPSFLKDRWADLSGGLSFDDFVRFLDDFQPALTKYDGKVTGMVFRMRADDLPDLKEGGYQDDAALAVEVETPSSAASAATLWPGSGSSGSSPAAAGGETSVMRAADVTLSGEATGEMLLRRLFKGKKSLPAEDTRSIIIEARKGLAPDQQATTEAAVLQPRVER